MKTVPQIYHEEASSASADLETAGQFPTYKSVKTAMYRKRAQKISKTFTNSSAAGDSTPMTKSEENLSILSEHSVWSMDGTFKIVPEWYQQMFTIHVFIADLSTYREIFDNLILKAAALGVVLQTQTVICDFETALIPALQGTFPG
ncbi:hypothetical protein T05_11283, partial [Trichinella murrelli]